MSFGISEIVSIGATIWLLVVVVRTVQMHRPDASKRLLAAVILSLASMVLGAVSSVLTPFLALRSGTDSYFKVMSVQSLFFTALNAVYFALFIPGIAKLARPRVEETPEGAPPYR
jgi:dipeptide/tripeptide permease